MARTMASGSNGCCSLVERSQRERTVATLCTSSHDANPRRRSPYCVTPSLPLADSSCSSSAHDSAPPGTRKIPSTCTTRRIREMLEGKRPDTEKRPEKRRCEAAERGGLVVVVTHRGRVELDEPADGSGDVWVRVADREGTRPRPRSAQLQRTPLRLGASTRAGGSAGARPAAGTLGLLTARLSVKI